MSIEEFDEAIRYIQDNGLLENVVPINERDVEK